MYHNRKHKSKSTYKNEILYIYKKLNNFADKYKICIITSLYVVLPGIPKIYRTWYLYGTLKIMVYKH